MGGHIFAQSIIFSLSPCVDSVPSYPPSCDSAISPCRRPDSDCTIIVSLAFHVVSATSRPTNCDGDFSVGERIAPVILPGLYRAAKIQFPRTLPPCGPGTIPRWRSTCDCDVIGSVSFRAGSFAEYPTSCGASIFLSVRRMWLPFIKIRISLRFISIP